MHKNNIPRLSVVAYACNLSIWEAEAEQSHIEVSLGYVMRLCLKNQNQTKKSRFLSVRIVLYFVYQSQNQQMMYISLVDEMTK